MDHDTDITRMKSRVIISTKTTQIVLMDSAYIQDVGFVKVHTVNTLFLLMLDSEFLFVCMRGDHPVSMRGNNKHFHARALKNNDNTPSKQMSFLLEQLACERERRTTCL